MNDDHGAMTTRRTMLLWGAASAFAAPTLARAGAEPAAGGAPAATPVPGTPAAPPAAPLPAATLERYMKMHASTGDGLSPWYYTGRIYAVRERAAPQLLYNFEGTEIYWVRRSGPNEWRTQASTLTFYRDAVTGAYLDSWVNPLNGRTVEVKPNVLRSKPGQFSRIGVESNDLMPGVSLPWQVEVSSVDGVCWFTTSRWLAAAPQPWLEAQTMFAPEAELASARRTSATTTFASTYLAPWSRWMEMGDAPGHLVWHAAGRKLRALKDLPKSYRERADRASATHFTQPG